MTKRPAKVVIVCPFYFCTDGPRAEITRRVFRHFAGTTFLGIGSEGAVSERVFAEHHPMSNYRHYEQTWDVPGGAGSEGLRDKFDFGIQAARELKPDLVFLIGSDDFQDLDYFAPSSGDLVVATGGVYIWRHGSTRDCRYYPHPCPPDLVHTGGAQGFSRAYLKAVGWRPFQNPGCEQGSERLARSMGATIDARPHAVWTVRGRTCLNKPSACQRRWPNARVSTATFAAFREHWDALGSDRKPVISMPSAPQPVVAPMPPAAPKSVSVIIPFAGECPARRQALEYVSRRYQAERPNWELVVGLGDEDAWCKATAVADGLQRSSGDILVIADGDVWSDDVGQAVDAVQVGAGWAVPHKYVHRLDAKSTERFLAGDRERLVKERAPYRGVVGGGIVVVPRDRYLEVPLDPRFIGWGAEDLAWAHALRTVVGKPARGGAILWHFWHPPQPSRNGGKSSEANRALRHQYARAERHTTVMRKLLEDAWPEGSRSR